MASVLYNSFINNQFTDSTKFIDLNDPAVVIKAALVKASGAGGYTFNAADDFWDDVATHVIGTPQTLANKTFTGRVFNADDVTFTAVSGAQVGYVVIYVDTAGANSTDPLIAYIDTATGLPVTPNGGDITITWDNGANGIFKI